MNWVFKQECADCKYCVDSECIHPHYMYCNHCEFWTPKWFEEREQMKIKNNKIIEITDIELFDLYLKSEMDDVMDFNEYKKKMKDAGYTVIENQ